jgi:nicotinamide mononucleotide adenylyltransferase
MIQYRKTWQNTARIARIIDNVVVCRDFVRSVFTIIITRVRGSIARISQIATAD